MSSGQPAAAAIVTVGNELLYGETVDTNAAWLGRKLVARGIPVVWRFTVGDEAEAIRTAVRSAMDEAELVIVSGGLGPTPDDLTKPTVASLFDRELRFDEALWEALEARFRARGFDKLPSTNRSQAEVPEGARVIPNPNGTAPGIAFEEESHLVVLLPGVPRELRGIFEGGLKDLLDECFDASATSIHHRVIHTSGVAESRLSELVAPVLPEDMGPVGLAFLPDLRGVDLRLTARGVPASEADDWLDRVEAAVAPVVARWRFEAESGDIVEALSAALLTTGRQVAVAESCTGGLVAKRITDLPGSSEVFKGGVVAYANEVKVSMLGVSAGDLEREGAVSEAVARAMAAGVAERLGAAAGIGVTGVAGPGGGTSEKPVGTVWVGIALDGEVQAHLVRTVGERAAIRERAAQMALDHMYRAVVRKERGA